MANTNPSRRAQRAQKSKILTYGHFGTASYDVESHAWHFLRQPRDVDLDEQQNDGLGNDDAHNSSFRLIRDISETCPSFGLDPIDESTAPNSITTHTILKYLPQAAVAIGSFKHNSSHNEAVVGSSSAIKQDEARGKLVFGSAKLFEESGVLSDRMYIPIFATVKGPANDTVQFACIGRETVSIRAETNTTIDVDVPALSDTLSHAWTSSYGPVHQLCFSNKSSLQGNSWLAARQSTGTTIFQPRVHSVPSGSNQIHCTTHSLDPNAILTIPSSCTGGAPHADVAFHPIAANLIAIIDVEGNWSTWEVRWKQSRSAKVLHTASLMASGSIRDGQQGHEPELSDLHYDDWHRICWLSINDQEIDTILVVDRRRAVVFDTSGGCRGLADMYLNKSSWILDITSESSALGECFVLTNSHLLWFSANTSGDISKEKKQPLSLIAGWNHFRNRVDNTLHFSSLTWMNVTYLLVISVNDTCATVYQFDRSNAPSGVQYTVHDPFVFELPVYPSFANERAIAISVETNQHQILQLSSPIPCFKLISVSASGSISEALYEVIGLRTNSSRGTLLTATIPLPNIQISMPQSTYLGDDAAEEVHVENFVVEDKHELLEKANASNIAIIKRAIVGKTGTVPQLTAARLYDLRMTYIEIAQASVPDEQKIDFEDFLDHLDRILQNLQTTPSHRQLLSALIHTRPRLDEIEEVSDLLTSWIDRHRLHNGLRGALKGDPTVTISMPHRRPLIDIYHEIVDSWVSSLSRSVPERIRIATEKHSRNVALELWLANITIQPLHRRRAKAKYARQEDHGLSSVTSPTLIASSEGTMPMPSQLSHSSSKALTEGNVVGQGLTAYTTFSRRLPLRANSKSVSNILGHLPTEIDEDPSLYDYRTTELSLALQEDEDALDGLDPRARRRAEKVARLKRKKLEQQQQAKKAALEQKTMLPSIMNSQIPIPIRAVQSSQAGPASSSQGMPQFSMTQPERGAFGRRDAEKGKRKKGF